MGFFSAITNSAERAMFKKKLQLQSDFKATQEFWEEGLLSAVLVDELNKKIALLRKREYTFLERSELRQQMEDRVKKEQPELGWVKRSQVVQELVKDAERCVKIYSYKDILKSEVVEDGNSVTYTKRMSQAASAVAGGLLLGGVGVLVGGLTGKKKKVSTVSNLSVNIVVKDTQNPLFQVKFLNKEREKKSKEYKNAITEANKLHALLSVLIEQADKEDEQQEPKNTTVNNFSVADELQKLSNLLEHGILTHEEYVTLKAKILSRA